MLKQIGIALTLLTALVIGAAAQNATTQTAGHAIIGEIKKVDRAAGKLIVKTADGTEVAFKFTGKTVFHGLKDGAKGIEEGSHAVVHYTGEGVEKTAVGIEHIGKDAPKFIEGTVIKTGKGVRTVVVKTPAGVEETMHLTERCVVDTGKGIAKGTTYVAKEGTHVIVHYTEVGGRKVGHLVKHIAQAM